MAPKRVRCGCIACAWNFMAERTERQHRSRRRTEEPQPPDPDDSSSTDSEGSFHSNRDGNNPSQSGVPEDASTPGHEQGQQASQSSGPASFSGDASPHSPSLEEEQPQIPDEGWPCCTAASPGEESDEAEAEADIADISMSNFQPLLGEEDAVDSGTPGVETGTPGVETVQAEFGTEDFASSDSLKGPLFPCQPSRCSIGQAIVGILKVAKVSNWSKQSTSRLLKLLANEILPEVNSLPADFHAASQLLAPFGVGYAISPCCIHDCCIFKDELGGAEMCPKCGAAALDPDGKPQKQYRHVSLTGALQQFYRNPQTAAQLQAPEPNADVMNDVWDGQAVADMRSEDPNFFAEPRNLLLGVCVDAFNPFNSGTYSVTPIVLNIYNFHGEAFLPLKIEFVDPATKEARKLARIGFDCLGQYATQASDMKKRDLTPLALPTLFELRMKEDHLILNGIIDGKKKPVSLNAYLEALTAELENLDQGVETYDAASKTTFLLRARLLASTQDYQGYRDVAMQRVSGNHACVKCHLIGARDPDLQKVLYTGLDRFLPANHPERSSPLAFLPVSDAWLERAAATIDSARSSDEDISTIVDTTGVLSRPVYCRLPYWSWHSSFLLEPMHIILNQGKRLLSIVLGRHDTLKLRAYYKSQNVYPELWVHGNRKPAAPYVIQPSGKAIVLDWLTQLKVPSAFGMKATDLFSSFDEDSTQKRLKSHDLLVSMTSGVLARAVQLGLGEAGRNAAHAITELCSAWQRLLNPIIKPEEIDSIEQSVAEALVLCERHLPASELVIMFHLMGHLCQQIRKYGPLRSTWMFGFESYLGSLKGAVKNRAQVQSSIMERISLFRGVSLLEAMLCLPGTQPHLGSAQQPRHITMLGSIKRIGLSSLDLEELQSYLKADHSTIYNSAEGKLRQGLEDPNASLWSVPYTASAAAAYGLSGDEIVMWVGAASLAQEAERVAIRGVNYRTFAGDERRATQDSGVAVTFLLEAGSCAYYGRIQRIVEVNFGGQPTVMLHIVFFLESVPNTTLPGTFLVQNSGRRGSLKEMWINAEKIDQQVFFAQDPQKEGWLHVFHYKSSGYVVPPHHFDVSGRMLDIP